MSLWPFTHTSKTMPGAAAKLCSMVSIDVCRTNDFRFDKLRTLLPCGLPGTII